MPPKPNYMNFLIQQQGMFSLGPKKMRTNNTSPVTIPSIQLNDPLFNHETTKADIIQSLPGAIKEGLVQGKLEADQTFIPDATELQQEKQIDILKDRGIIELAKLAEVGILDIDLFLADRTDMANQFIILSQYVVLKSYVASVASDLVETIQKNRIIELENVELKYVPSSSPDYTAITKICLDMAKDLILDIPTEDIFIHGSDKNEANLPDYIVTPAVKHDIKYALESMLAIPSASKESSAFRNSFKEISQYINNEEKLTSFVLNRAAQLNDENITKFLGNEFSQAKDEINSIPAPILTYYSEKLAPAVRDLYQKSLVDEVRALYNRERMDCLASLMIHLRGILDISKHEKKLAGKIFHDLQESISKQPPYYLTASAASMNMATLEKYLISEISKSQEPDFDLNNVLSVKQKQMIKGLEKLLKSTEDPTVALQLSTIIVHGKVLRYERQYGLLEMSDKYTQKVLKDLEKRVDVKEVHALKDAIKKHHATAGLIIQVKDVALGGFH